MTPRSARPVRATDSPSEASPFALGLVMRRAHERAAAALTQAVKPAGIELRHFAVLITLHTRGALSQAGLSRATGSDKATMVRTIDDLERLGAVERHAHPSDRRVHVIEITPRGYEIFDEAHERAVPLEDELTAHLTDREKATLLKLLIRFAWPGGEAADQ